MTQVVGTVYNGSTAATSHAITVPAGVTSDMVAVFLIGTGSSDAAVTTLSRAGSTFTKIDEQNAANTRVAVWTGTNLTAGNTVTLALSTSQAVTVAHYYQNDYSITGASLSAAIRATNVATTTSGAVTATAGQRVLVLGVERTTAATTVSSVTSSGGETVTQISYGEGTGSAQASCYIGSFVASTSGSRTSTITYSNSSANGYAATVLTAATSGPAIVGAGIPARRGFGTGTVTPSIPIGGIGIPTRRAFGAGTVTPQRVVVGTGIPPRRGFGVGSLRVPSALGPEPDSDQMQVEWWAIPRSAPAFVLHEVGDFSISEEAGSRGSISIDVPLGSTTHDQLHALTVAAGADLEVEIRLHGGQARSMRGYLQESSADTVAETGKRTWSGCLTAGLLYESALAPEPSDPKKETHFAGKNAGQIAATLVAAAKARSEITDITTATFNSTVDTLGNPWDASTTITLTPGSLLGETLAEFEELGLAEHRVTAAKELQLFVPGTRGTDRTVGADQVVLHRGRDLTDAPETWSVRDSITDILVAGKEGVYETAGDANARARRGRKIVGYASAGQVENSAAVQAYAQNKLGTLTPAARELSHGLIVNGPGPQPFVDIQVGDWIWSDTGSPQGPERLRVQQVALSRSGDEFKAVAVVGTLSMSAIVALKRRLARLERGTTVVGTSVDPTDPDAGGEDTTPPAAPVGLVASSIAYQGELYGETLARIDLGWQAVTTDARGDVSPAAQAAQLILDRIESGAPVFEDWTWTGAPALVTTHNDTLLAAYAAAGNTDPIQLETARTWLQGYITDAEQDVSDPTVADDISGYRVRYAYVGLGQVGGIPSSDPFLDTNTLAFYEPEGSPTSATALAFGGVGAGREVRLQVAAFDTSGNQSVWSQPLTITTAVDNLPPPATSAPVLATWFRTLDVYWNGKTVDGADMLAAAPDFDHVAVIVAQSASITPPPMTGDPVAFNPALTGPQWVANLYTAGTYNVPNLPVGVGWYAALVAVDLAGNVSGTSAVAGPATAQKLVQIDIGPDAVGRLQIIDGEIVRAKIDDLAVNSAKVEEIQVGLLTAGTMTATITNSGLFRTATSGNRVEFDSAGLRLFQGSTVVGRWQTSDASMLMTGTFQTGLSGERLVLFTDGTLRFYPTAGTNYSQIANFGNDVVWRGPLDGNSRSGRVNVNVLGVGLNFSSESEIPNDLRAEVAVFDRRVRLTSPNIHLQVNGKLATTDGSPRRVMFSQTNSSGVDVGASFVQYRMASSGAGGFSGNGAGIKFEAGQVLVCGADDLNSFGVIKATDFVPSSSRLLKVDIRDAIDTLSVGRVRDLFTTVKARSWLPAEGDTTRRRFGLVVEELAAVAPELVQGMDGPEDQRGYSLPGVVAMNWAGLAEVNRRLDTLIERLRLLVPALRNLDV